MGTVAFGKRGFLLFRFGVQPFPSRASRDGVEVPLVGRGVQATRTGISIVWIDPLDHRDGGRGDGNVISGGNPVFRAGLGISESFRGKLGNEIVSVREAIISAARLGGDKVCES